MLAAAGNFLKTLLPGAKNLLQLGRRGATAAAGSFRHARNVGVGTRLTNAAAAGRTGIARNWAQLGPAGQTAARNAGITLAAGAGYHAISSGRQGG